MIAAARFAFDEAHWNGVIDRPVELVLREVDGMPLRQFNVMRQTYLDLVHAEHCIGIIGPHFTDQVTSLLPTIEQAHVPMVTMCSSADVPSEYCFTLGNISTTDEAVVMAEYLHEKGATAVAILQEDNYLGQEFHRYFRLAARRISLPVVADRLLPNFVDTEAAEVEVAETRAAGADAIVYMGLGLTARQVLTAVNGLMTPEWNPIRLCSSIFVGWPLDGYFGLTIATYEGWTGTDEFDERNPVFAKLTDRHQNATAHCYSALGYDAGQTMAWGLSLAKPHDPEGLKCGLERIHRLPAAVGSPGTYISFGRYDRRGYKGPFVVLRRIEDAKCVLAQ
ncbi:ABC transporter substrate-binding protein [Mycobacterium seoulense]|uniref:ABC transporter substrate-binding protein n=1 Tax=Mycobacterium seoulense TaxID=386911 RepID=UPI003CEEA6C3